MGTSRTIYTGVETAQPASTQSVPAVDRVLSIVEALAASSRGLRLAEVVSTCKLPRSSTHCILLTLQRRGYLCRNPQSGRYHFEPKLLRLFDDALGSCDLREAAEPHLYELMLRTKLTANLGVTHSAEGIVLACVRSRFSERPAPSWPGKRMELHCTALGKALLTGWTDDQVESFVRENGLSKHNENTIGSLHQLRHRLINVRNMGFAIDEEESALGHSCVAAPVRDAQGAVTAAVSVSGTSSEITLANVSTLAAAVRRTAEEMSRAFIGKGGRLFN